MYRTAASEGITDAEPCSYFCKLGLYTKNLGIQEGVLNESLNTMSCELHGFFSCFLPSVGLSQKKSLKEILTYVTTLGHLCITLSPFKYIYSWKTLTYIFYERLARFENYVLYTNPEYILIHQKNLRKVKVCPKDKNSYFKLFDI